MHKRVFFGATALLGGAPLLASAATVTAFVTTGPALLTITGAIARPNRGPFDPALDQMMHKQKLGFIKAWQMDYAALVDLPALTIRPTLEYDGKPHQLRGPLLIDVLKAAGATVTDDSRLTLRAVDGFAVALTVKKARDQRFIVATHLDGKPMALGGLGPLWALVDADRIAALAAQPVNQRFGECPWALYHIDVQA